MMKKIQEYIGVQDIVFSLYVIFVVGTQVFLKWFGHWIFYVEIILTIIIAFVLCPLVMKKIRKITIKNCGGFRKHLMLPILLLFLSVFLCFFLNYLVFYPWNSTVDTLNQYQQAVIGKYNDWHPVLHTLLVYKIPLLLTNGWIGSVILFQIILFSFAVTYNVYTVAVYTNWWYGLFVLSFIMINPQTTNFAMYPLKDTALAIGILFLITFLANIFFSDGNWLTNKAHIFILAVTLSITTILRHNAIFFTLPFLVAILFYTTKKQGILILSICAVLFVVIKGPLYQVLAVEQPDKRQLEMLGLPLNVIGGAVSSEPEQLDDEVKTFAYQLVPQEVWESEYVDGYFNGIKCHEQFHAEVIERYGASKIVNYMFRCIKSVPGVSLKALIKTTEPVYSICGDYSSYIFLSGFDKTDNSIILFLRNLKIKYTEYSLHLFPHLLEYVGVLMMVLFCVMLSKYQLNKLENIKKILLILPIFCYNFGTMLLLTAYDDCARFFYYTFLVTPVLLIILLKEEKSEKE